MSLHKEHFLVEGDETNANIRINHWQRSRGWPSHLHIQIELIYVHKGALEVHIDSQKRILQKGEFAVAFPNCVHSYHPVPGIDDIDVMFYLVKPHLLGDYADKLRGYIPTTPFIEQKDLPPDVRVALGMLKRQEHHIYLPVLKAYIEIILSCLWDTLNPILTENRDVDLPYQVLRYMTKHFQQPITLESTAQALGVSKNHLSRIISQKLHMHFLQYLNFLRIELAMHLLSGTNRSITEILYECGYESPRTFNRVFQEICGISPREYRQQHRIV